MKSLTKHIAGDILTYLKSEKDEMESLLEKMVHIESPSNDPQAQAQMVNFLKEKLQDLNFHAIHFPGKKTGGFLYARPKNRVKNSPLQLLVGHCDTVWKLDTLSTMPIIKDGQKMSGPGVYDMKAGITQMIFALKTISALNLSQSLTPIVIINTDEEIGSRESTRAIEKLAKISERAFIMEPPLGLKGKLKTARKGLGRFTIKVKGKAAHAGLDPQKGINAIIELSHQVQKLYAMNDFDKGISVNVGMIEGGVSPNVVAPESKAIIDVRVLNEKDGEEITKRIYALQPIMKDVKLHIEGGIGRPPMERTKGNQVLWKLARTKGDLLGLNLEEATAGGGSDGNTTSKYTATLDGLGITGDGAHASHEFIFLKEFPVRTALLTLLLLAEPLSEIKSRSDGP